MAIGWMIKVDVTGDGYKDSSADTPSQSEIATKLWPPRGKLQVSALSKSMAR
jgi:hypothetical protein